MLCVAVESMPVSTGTGRTLPLLHHTLELVVQHNDLDANVELRRRRELHCRHAERRVAVDVDDSLLWRTDFCADGRWETEAHRLRR